jgi:hypothetical protein
MAAADLRSLRRRCERRCAGLPIPAPFDAETLVARVSEQRGRPILLRAVPGLEPGATGVWLAIGSPPADVIAYAPGTSRLHRDHIILHELSHILCDHAPRLHDGELADALFPDIRPDVVLGVLQRIAYSDEEELEAELLATLIQAGASSRGAGGPGAGACGGGDLARRLEAFADGEAAP